ncbi:MAG: pyridoxamine 5'-phosphate oxidase [Bacteroidota bacterium]
MREDIASIRKEYTKDTLDIKSVHRDPISQFENWFDEALKSGIVEPNAMTLATVDQAGSPLQRTVLLKKIARKAFIFFSNYNSRKALHIDANAHVSLLFPWYQLERQVIICGIASKISTEETKEYFQSRPRGSQLGAWVSEQSTIIEGRNVLEDKLRELENKYSNIPIPVPPHWGGYEVVPSTIEFWQGGTNRLHDRILYTKNGNDWGIDRLSP